MPSSFNPSRRDGWLILVAAVAYGLFVDALLPGRPIAMNDDFGYLRSVVETIQHGRPWTNDFLGPWSYSLAAVSALVFKLTGSFAWATIGLQALMAAVSFWLVCRIALDCGLGSFAAAGLAAALLTFPTVLWKQVEYTALVIYLPCLFASFWFARRERWTLFLLAWAVAVASRQSALAWLAIPVIAGIEAGVRERDFAKLKAPMLIIILGLGWYFLLNRFANETHAQRFITGHVLSDATVSGVSRNLKTGLWVLAVAAGWAGLVFDVLPGRFRRKPPAAPVRLAGTVIALALLASVPFVAREIALSYEHPLFENSWAVGYLRGTVVVAALGWLFAVPSVRLPFLGAALAALVLACLRAEMWDYYLIDAAVLAFFAVQSGRTGTATDGPAVRIPWLQPALAGGLLLGVIALQLNATGPLKRHIDHSAGHCVVLERALRAGWMKPTELSDAPFGFVAWHLLPYYLSHEGKASVDLGGFGIYMAGDSVNVVIEGVSRKDAAAAKAGAVAPDPAHPFAEILPRGWFGYARFSLDRLNRSRPPAVAIPAEAYQYQQFPLNDAEWRELIGTTAGK